MAAYYGGTPPPPLPLPPAGDADVGLLRPVCGYTAVEHAGTCYVYGGVSERGAVLGSLFACGADAAASADGSPAVLRLVATTGAPAVPPPTAFHHAAVHNGRMYVLEGLHDEAGEAEASAGAAAPDERSPAVWCLDLATRVWARADRAPAAPAVPAAAAAATADAPPRTIHGGACVVGDAWYLYGGFRVPCRGERRAGPRTPDEASRTLHSFSFERGVWGEAVDIPEFPRLWGHAMARLGDDVVVIQGGTAVDDADGSPRETNKLCFYSTSKRTGKVVGFDQVTDRLEVRRAKHALKPPPGAGEGSGQLAFEKDDLFSVLEGPEVQSSMAGWYRGLHHPAAGAASSEPAAAVPRSGWFPVAYTTAVDCARLVSREVLPRPTDLTASDRGRRFQLRETGDVVVVEQRYFDGRRRGAHHYRAVPAAERSDAERALAPSLPDAPHPRSLHAGCVAGDRLVVWAGEHGGVTLPDLWLLDLACPDGGAWERVAAAGDAPPATASLPALSLPSGGVLVPHLSSAVNRMYLFLPDERRWQSHAVEWRSGRAAAAQPQASSQPRKRQPPPPPSPQQPASAATSLAPSPVPSPSLRCSEGELSPAKPPVFHAPSSSSSAAGGASSPPRVPARGDGAAVAAEPGAGPANPLLPSAGPGPSSRAYLANQQQRMWISPMKVRPSDPRPGPGSDHRGDGRSHNPQPPIETSPLNVRNHYGAATVGDLPPSPYALRTPRVHIRGTESRGQFSQQPGSVGGGPGGGADDDENGLVVLESPRAYGDEPARENPPPETATATAADAAVAAETRVDAVAAATPPQPPSAPRPLAGPSPQTTVGTKMTPVNTPPATPTKKPVVLHTESTTVCFARHEVAASPQQPRQPSPTPLPTPPLPPQQQGVGTSMTPVDTPVLQPKQPARHGVGTSMTPILGAKDSPAARCAQQPPQQARGTPVSVAAAAPSQPRLRGASLHSWEDESTGGSLLAYFTGDKKRSSPPSAAAASSQPRAVPPTASAPESLRDGADARGDVYDWGYQLGNSEALRLSQNTPPTPPRDALPGSRSSLPHPLSLPQSAAYSSSSSSSAAVAAAASTVAAGTTATATVSDAAASVEAGSCGTATPPPASSRGTPVATPVDVPVAAAAAAVQPPQLQRNTPPPTPPSAAAASAAAAAASVPPLSAPRSERPQHRVVAAPAAAAREALESPRDWIGDAPEVPTQQEPAAETAVSSSFSSTAVVSAAAAAAPPREEPARLPSPPSDGGFGAAADAAPTATAAPSSPPDEGANEAAAAAAAATAAAAAAPPTPLPAGVASSAADVSPSPHRPQQQPPQQTSAPRTPEDATATFAASAFKAFDGRGSGAAAGGDSFDALADEGMHVLRVRKSDGEPMGLTFEGGRLVKVRAGGAGERCGAAQYLGRRLTHVAGLDVRGFKSVKAATRRIEGDVALRFDDEQLGGELVDLLRTSATRLGRTTRPRRFESPPAPRAHADVARSLSPSLLRHTTASLRKRRSFSSNDPDSYPRANLPAQAPPLQSPRQATQGGGGVGSVTVGGTWMFQGSASTGLYPSGSPHRSSRSQLPDPTPPHHHHPTLRTPKGSTSKLSAKRSSTSTRYAREGVFFPFFFLSISNILCSLTHPLTHRARSNTPSRSRLQTC